MRHGVVKGSLIALALGSIFLLSGCQSQTKQSTHPKQLSYEQRASINNQKQILNYSNDDAKAVGGFGARTTGGKKATKNHTYVVKNAKQLQVALNKNLHNQPRKILLSGYINKAEDQDGNHLNQVSYVKRAGHTNYNSEDYLHDFQPGAKKMAKSNRKTVEAARKHVARIQRRHIRINIPSNTTIIGEKNSQIAGTEFHVNHKDNVILRNLHIEAPKDEFPKWSVKKQRWIPKYNAITIKHSKNVWIDHNTLTDKPELQSTIKHFNKPYIQYGHLIGIGYSTTNVTISNNSFEKHNHVIRIGRGNNKKKLSNVTLVHNRFMDTSSHMPYITNANVDLLNNEYDNDDKTSYTFQHAWRLGHNAHVYASGNTFNISKDPKNLKKRVIVTLPNQQISDYGSSIDNANIKLVTKNQVNKTHVKSQKSFNHKAQAIQTDFGATLD